MYWFLLVSVLAGTAQEWKSRTIYQLLTDRFAIGNGNFSDCGDLGNYCGGTFKGIQENLDYITGMGFDAIWISPVLPNTPGSYHGYAAVDFYGVNPHFGTEEDLIDLVKACHGKGVWVMLDVVANHVGPVAPDYTKINPFNKEEYYHNYCPISDWNNQTEVEWCWLFQLPDLKQENPYVRFTLLNWVNWIVQKYDIDGLRIDTGVEVPQIFWSQFSKNAGVFTIGEVFNGDISYVASYQGPFDATLNYPLFFKLRDLFQNDADLYQARVFMGEEAVFPDQYVLGSFVDNHDNTRFLYKYPNQYRFQNALAWSFTTLGIPIMYYGDQQGFNGGNDPANREILWPFLSNTTGHYYQFVKKVVSFRKQMEVWKYPWVQRYADHHFYSFSRGKAMMAFSNTDDQVFRQVSYHPYYQGEVVCNVIWEGDCVTVTSEGVPVTLLHGETKLFKPKTAVK